MSFQYCTSGGIIKSNFFRTDDTGWGHFNYDCTLGVRPAMWIAASLNALDEQIGALQEGVKQSFGDIEKPEKVYEATPSGSNNAESEERISVAEGKVAEIIRALKERYPEGSDLPKSFEEMKFYNSDLQLSTLDKWTKIAYQTKARDYLIQKGLLRSQSKEQYMSTQRT